MTFLVESAVDLPAKPLGYRVLCTSCLELLGRYSIRACAPQRTCAAMLAPLTISLSLLACTGVNTRTADGQPVRMTRSEFAEYVETTFRYHNRVLNELITLISLGDDESSLEPSVVQAEEKMASRCQPLNAMVSATIEGREIPLWARVLLLNQVPECEAASRELEELISIAL